MHQMSALKMLHLWLVISRGQLLSAPACQDCGTQLANYPTRKVAPQELEKVGQRRMLLQRGACKMKLASAKQTCGRRALGARFAPFRHVHASTGAKAKGRRALQVCAVQKTQEKSSSQDGAARQLLGIKGAADETNIWKIRLQLTKPVTWVPLIWGVGCGAAASGHYVWNDPTMIAQLLTCMVMSGPLLTGYTQTINDYCDREIDAINEPYRPIPSGRISEPEVIAQILVLLFGGLGVAYGLDRWASHEEPIMLYLALFGSFISYIYSAPPLKLKQNGWIGNYALGSSYIALPWWAGQSLFGTLSADVVVLTMLYSIAGLGIAIVNDFKSIEGDRALGLQSLPVAFGVDTAKWICAASIDITQLSVAAYLAFGLGLKGYAAVLLGLILPQIYFQFKFFLPDPIANDVKYQASAQPFLVFGLLTTGLAIGHFNAM